MYHSCIWQPHANIKLTVHSAKTLYILLAKGLAILNQNKFVAMTSDRNDSVNVLNNLDSFYQTFLLPF